MFDRSLMENASQNEAQDAKEHTTWHNFGPPRAPQSPPGGPSAAGFRCSGPLRFDCFALICCAAVHKTLLKSQLGSMLGHFWAQLRPTWVPTWIISGAFC